MCVGRGHENKSAHSLELIICPWFWFSWPTYGSCRKPCISVPTSWNILLLFKHLCSPSLPSPQQEVTHAQLIHIDLLQPYLWCDCAIGPTTQELWAQAETISALEELQYWCEIRGGFWGDKCDIHRTDKRQSSERKGGEREQMTGHLCHGASGGNGVE